MNQKTASLMRRWIKGTGLGRKLAYRLWHRMTDKEKGKLRRVMKAERDRQLERTPNLR